MTRYRNDVACIALAAIAFLASCNKDERANSNYSYARLLKYPTNGFYLPEDDSKIAKFYEYVVSGKCSDPLMLAGYFFELPNTYMNTT